VKPVPENTVPSLCTTPPNRAKPCESRPSSRSEFVAVSEAPRNAPASKPSRLSAFSALTACGTSPRLGSSMSAPLRLPSATLAPETAFAARSVAPTLPVWIFPVVTAFGPRSVLMTLPALILFDVTLSSPRSALLTSPSTMSSVQIVLAA
jgi:hypothetical protein